MLRSIPETFQVIIPERIERTASPLPKVLQLLVDYFDKAGIEYDEATILSLQRHLEAPADSSDIPSEDAKRFIA